MGLYDEVRVKCPHCKEDNYLQSKKGDCELDTYYLTDAPDAILKDIAKNKQYCERCGGHYDIELYTKLIGRIVVRY